MSALRASSARAGLQTGQPLGGADRHQVEGTVAAAPAASERSAAWRSAISIVSVLYTGGRERVSQGRRESSTRARAGVLGNRRLKLGTYS